MDICGVSLCIYPKGCPAKRRHQAAMHPAEERLLPGRAAPVTQAEGLQAAFLVKGEESVWQ